MNDDRSKLLTRRRLFIVSGAIGIALTAFGLRSLSTRARVGKSINNASDIPPDANTTVLAFIGALFGRELSEPDLADLSDRLGYLFGSGAPYNQERVVLVHYLNGLARSQGATAFSSCNALQKEAIIQQTMKADYESVLSRLLWRVSKYGRDHHRMRRWTVPQLSYLYRHSAAAWRARGYVRWPGIPGDWREILAPGMPYP